MKHPVADHLQSSCTTMCEKDKSWKLSGTYAVAVPAGTSSRRNYPQPELWQLKTALESKRGRIWCFTCVCICFCMCPTVSLRMGSVRICEVRRENMMRLF